MRSLFPSGEAGEAAFEHLFVTLARRKGRVKAVPVRIGTGLWQVGKTICVFARKRAAFEDDELKAITRTGVTHLFMAPGVDCPQPPGILKRTAITGEVLKSQIGEFSPFATRYGPESSEREAIGALRSQFDGEMEKLHGKIQFVGMSVYKIEASEGIPMDRIYIPLRVAPETAEQRAEGSNPLELLSPGSRHVILGDPGSGKSTLLRFIALVGTQPELRKRYGAKVDSRLCVYVALRRYGDALKSRPNLKLIDFIVELARADLRLKGIDIDWLEYYLYARDAILLLDGLDELPDAKFKQRVRKNVGDLLNRYPGNTTIMTSRIVGYEKEVRYDELGFSHQRVARLNLDDIQTFVGRWYETRIDSIPDRESHVKDLVAIVSDAANTSIRELAENPLLLTIISLVHRIDAVLPDQRVVLYQKCTETLLNTWHTWKYHSEHPGVRPKAEQRNTARMEALAYWMHCLMDGTGKQERSVVRYGDLKEFLARYIATIERNAAAADELAEEFLRFVKERAGLLIEVGDGQYSFLHLTFQEYLAATHLRMSGEVGGVAAIWKLLESERRDANPLWHEVIRLLAASLKKEEAQRYLLERILPVREDKDLRQRAIVLGGCLLDSIDAAEAMSDLILDRILRAAVAADTVDSLRGPLRFLSQWQERGAEQRKQIRKVALVLKGSEAERGALALTLACLGWEAGELKPFDEVFTGPKNQRLGVLFSDCVGMKKGVLDEDERQFLAVAAADLAVVSPGGNLLSMALTVWAPAEMPRLPRPAFRQLMVCFTHLDEGPAEHFMNNVLTTGSSPHSSPDAFRTWRTPDEGRLRSLASLFHGIRTPINSLQLARHRFRQLYTIFEERAVELVMGLGGVRQARPGWDFVLSDATTHGALIDGLCHLVGLKGSPHWWEAIRLRLLPQIPGRITIANADLWRSVELAFASDQASEADIEHAAVFLLLDIWLWLTKSYQKREASQFRRLAGLTRGHSAPQLRVAHCLRDIAHGDESREADLSAMMQSDDPATQRMFVDAFWIDDPGSSKRKRTP